MFGFLGRSQGSTHRFCQQNLSAYIDGELAARDQEKIRQHLQQCQACRWDLQTLRHTVSLLRGLPRVQRPRSFHIPESMPAPAVPVWMRPWAYGLMRSATAAAATVLLVLLAGNALALPGATGAAMPRATVMQAPVERGAAQASEPAGGREDKVAATAPAAAEATSGPGVLEQATLPPVSENPLALQSLPTPPVLGLGGAEPTLAPAEATRAAAAPPGMGAGPAPGSPTEAARGGGCEGECGPGATEVRRPPEALVAPTLMVSPTFGFGIASASPLTATVEITRTPKALMPTVTSVPFGPLAESTNTPLAEPTAEVGAKMVSPSPESTTPAAEDGATTAQPGAAIAPTNAPAPATPVPKGQNATAVAGPASEAGRGVRLVYDLGPRMMAARQRLASYPLREWAAGSAGLVVVLVAATVWLAKARSRWP